MKFLTCIVFAVVIIGSTATPTVGTSSAVSSNNNQELETEAQPALTNQVNNEYNRFRKSAGYGGGASIPAPPCPKNYLFSCQPNLAPVPCAAPAAYGSGGAYSVPVPSYVAPLGIPQPYPGYVQQPFNQYY